MTKPKSDLEEEMESASVSVGLWPSWKRIASGRCANPVDEEYTDLPALIAGIEREIGRLNKLKVDAQYKLRTEGKRRERRRTR